MRSGTVRLYVDYILTSLVMHAPPNVELGLVGRKYKYTNTKMLARETDRIIFLLAR